MSAVTVEVNVHIYKEYYTNDIIVMILSTNINNKVHRYGRLLRNILRFSIISILDKLSCLAIIIFI